MTLYKTILADPPWRYDNWTDAKQGAAASAMTTMATEDIAALPVGDLATPRGSFLFMWGTWPKLPDALRVLEGWGFAYITAFPWVKYTPNTARLRTGTGFWIRGMSEILIVARRPGGKRAEKLTPPGLLCGSEFQFYAPRGGHSDKPLEIHAWIERVTPAPRVELFARAERPGWDCFGYDTGWALTPSGITPHPPTTEVR
jgi:N6-adenosine-specific RNA methylase IME4